MHPSFEQLLAFVTVVEEGSFRAAARKLHKTQPTVSAAVHSLELELEIALFERKHGKAVLTNQGKHLSEIANPLLMQYLTLLKSAYAMKDSEQVVYRLGIDPLLSNHAVRQAIHEFSKAFPDTNLKLVTKPSSVLGEMLAHGELDLALANPYHKNIYEFRFTELFNINFWWVAHKALICDQDARLLLLEGCKEINNASIMKQHHIWQCEDLNTIVNLCCQQSGIALLPDFIIEALNNDHLVKVNNHPYLFGRKVTTAIISQANESQSRYHQWFCEQLAPRKVIRVV
ncbi:LysR family transcriptional regulator [Vibrio sp. Sgm 22]|uniref:LysR family transcriptional regulator n=1 Tax=unclassified Vibrio TaxID=2614977 RepID=UPI002248D9B2|nr:MULTISPECIES: LysR family transcriptional regulator [unclassified Vibrio]MCX2758861.1 LysR family transcriptional regulator [Vibrio sp. 14G-20]MCX2775957.1 LysR family transcriptional regulator [Vibrio sp. Sgm 22]